MSEHHTDALSIASLLTVKKLVKEQLSTGHYVNCKSFNTYLYDSKASDYVRNLVTSFGTPLSVPVDSIKQLEEFYARYVTDVLIPAKDAQQVRYAELTKLLSEIEKSIKDAEERLFIEAKTDFEKQKSV